MIYIYLCKNWSYTFPVAITYIYILKTWQWLNGKLTIVTSQGRYWDWVLIKNRLMFLQVKCSHMLHCNLKVKKKQHALNWNPFHKKHIFPRFSFDGKHTGKILKGYLPNDALILSKAISNKNNILNSYFHLKKKVQDLSQ